MRGEREPGPARAAGISLEWAGVPALDRCATETKAQLEAGHWWYRGRRRIVLDLIGRLDLPRNADILDAGCGVGSMLDGLGRFGGVTGTDVNPQAVARAGRHSAGPVFVAPLDRLPLDDRRFDLVTCLDVLEHVRDDRAALAELFRVTRPGGRLVLTVPAYPSLWSAHDRAAGHRRRYLRPELIRRAARAGWEPVLDTHFNALLLPAAAIRRRITRHTRRLRSDLLAPGPRPDRLLELPLLAEARWLAAGRRIGWGLSILAVFARPAGGP